MQKCRGQSHSVKSGTSKPRHSAGAEGAEEWRRKAGKKIGWGKWRTTATPAKASFVNGEKQGAPRKCRRKRQHGTYAATHRSGRPSCRAARRRRGGGGCSRTRQARLRPYNTSTSPPSPPPPPQAPVRQPPRRPRSRPSPPRDARACGRTPQSSRRRRACDAQAAVPPPAPPPPTAVALPPWRVPLPSHCWECRANRAGCCCCCRRRCCMAKRLAAGSVTTEAPLAVPLGPRR